MLAEMDEEFGVGELISSSVERSKGKVSFKQYNHVDKHLKLFQFVSLPVLHSF